VNVDVHASIEAGANGGEYIALKIPRSVSVPSTIDGRYLIRTTDGRKPVTGNDWMRLGNERASFSWESLTTLEIPIDHADQGKVAAFERSIRNSDRPKSSVKEKTTPELLEHYALSRNKLLTNLMYRDESGAQPPWDSASYPDHQIRFGRQQSSKVGLGRL
jgi:ATP-dependent DNA helicase RecG